MGASPPRISRGLELGRRRRPARALLTFAVSLATAVGLATVVYLVVTTLPYLATSPSTDTSFGALNQCLMDGLREPRVGFVVRPGGDAVAGFGGSTLAVCAEHPPVLRTLSLPGITAGAFDFAGNLWLATAGSGERGPRLWRLPPGYSRVEEAGDWAPIALAGHRHGVAALDGSGRVVSFSADHRVLGYAQLPAAPVGGAQLATNADGSLLAVVAGAGLFVFEAANLQPVSAEGPCEVEFLWWMPQPEHARVSCGPRASWALDLWVRQGRQEMAPARERTRSALVPMLDLFVQACDVLPCTASPP